MRLSATAGGKWLAGRSGVTILGSEEAMKKKK